MESLSWHMDRPPGSLYLGDGRVRFRVWAPKAHRVTIRLLTPTERRVSLMPEDFGHHVAEVADVPPGTRYTVHLDDGPPRPDPASRFQPLGVHGPSEIVDPHFPWSDTNYRGIDWPRIVLYELHVGTFTPEGTFDAIIPRLDDLRSLGVTAIELMPLAQFPGERNWGYDGVQPYAVQNSYGGPTGLKRLIDACHARGLAVFLDVVYNHLGPEGNYLGEFGPYFTDAYRTPWGSALNFDGPDSDAVRAYFLLNALRWLEEFHFDGLRLDAANVILDHSPQHLLASLTQAVHARHWPRLIHLVAETDANDPRYVRDRDHGGYQLTAQWNDDFHHALRTLLTGERAGYYRDYGQVGDLALAYQHRYVYAGRYSAFLRRQRGASAADIPASRFVLFCQNHDQVGNRCFGDRLSTAVSLEAQKLAVAATLLSPGIPMLFMGQEYGETNPFPYFVSHSDPQLIEAVRAGRRQEFTEFLAAGEPPDPQAEATFLSAKLRPELRHREPHCWLWDLHRFLLQLRQTVPALSDLSGAGVEAVPSEPQRVLQVRRPSEGAEVILVMRFAAEPLELTLPLPAGRWRVLVNTASPQWGGSHDLPTEWNSSGSVTLPLPGHGLIAFQRLG